MAMRWRVRRAARDGILDLSNSNLVELPPWMAQLTNLQELNLRFNGLRELPAWIGQLTNLHTLDLWHNGLRELPAELGQLTNLQELNLGFNGLRELPAWIGQLTNLRTLELLRNQLTELPAELGQLTNLQELNLGSNQLTELPAELGQLTNLYTLVLGGSQLTELPAELGQLTNLQELNLSFNQLTELPAELGQLTNLRKLNLLDNGLHELPAELGQLSLHTLNLMGNPVVAPLPELAQQGTAAVLAYLRSLAKGAGPSYEAKLVLVGTARVGKSSLLARLRGEGFDPDRDSTHGIDLDQLLVTHPQRPVRITLNTWDSGGQEVYQLTHQVFYSTQALYVLVWHPGQPDEPAAVDQWLARIRLQVGQQARVLVVASHADDHLAVGLDQARLRARHGAVLAGFYQVDSRSGRGVAEVRVAIAAQAAALLPVDGERLSDRWVSVRTALRDRPELFIAYAEYMRVCHGHETDDQDEVDALLGLLHTRGLVLHYANDPSLWNVVVLQPEWLTSAVSHILDDDQTRQAHGVLEHERLAEIWQTGLDGRPYSDRARRYLLGLMWRFAVAYQLEDRDASLVPQLLPQTAPPLPWSHDSAPPPGWRVPSLVWHLDEPAPGLLAQLTVKTRLYTTGRHWQAGVLLQPAQQPATQALLTLDPDDPRRLQLTIHTAAPTLLFGELIGIVRQLLAARWRGLAYQELLCCPTILDAAVRCSGLFDLTAVTDQQQLDTADPGLQCPQCRVVWDAAALLAGEPTPTTKQSRRGERAAPAGQPLAGVIVAEQLAAVFRAELWAANRSVHDRFDQQAGMLADLQQGVGRIERSQALLLEITLDDYRAGTARPKLFTLVPADGRLARLQGAVRVQLELTLWCQHWRGVHPHMTYTISRTAAWLQTAAPYLRLASAALAMAAGLSPAAIAVAMPKLDPTARNKIDLTAKLAEKLLPKRSQRRQQQARLDAVIADTPTLAPDRLLRRVNKLIDEADPQGDYGGLTLRFAPSGELLWVCPQHADDYDSPSRSHEPDTPIELTRAGPPELGPLPT